MYSRHEQQCIAKQLLTVITCMAEPVLTAGDLFDAPGDSEEAEEEAPPQPSDPLRHAVCSSAKVAALMANLAKQQEGYAAEVGCCELKGHHDTVHGEQQHAALLQWLIGTTPSPACAVMP